MNMEVTKKCGKCYEVKNINCFGPRVVKGKEKGWRSYCKKCEKVASLASKAHKRFLDKKKKAEHEEYLKQEKIRSLIIGKEEELEELQLLAEKKANETNTIPQYHLKCPRCRTIKHFEDFNFDSRRKTGYRSYCRKCDSESAVESRRKQKEDKGAKRSQRELLHATKIKVVINDKVHEGELFYIASKLKIAQSTLYYMCKNSITVPNAKFELI